MNLPLSNSLVFPFFPTSKASSSQPLRPTLSAISKTLSAFTKKPASPAGFFYFILIISRLSALFLPAAYRRPGFTLPSLPAVLYSNSKPAA